MEENDTGFDTRESVAAAMESESIQERLARIQALKAKHAQAADPTGGAEEQGAWYNPYTWYKQANRWAYKKFIKPATVDADKTMADGEVKEGLPSRMARSAMSAVGLDPETAQDGDGFTDKLGRSIKRGVHNSLREGAKFGLEAGGWLESTFDLGSKAGLDKQDVEEFRSWYNQASNDINVLIPGTSEPLLASKQVYEKYAGRREDGAYGFVEDVTQVAVGIAGVGKVTGGISLAKGAVGNAGKLLNASKFTKAMLDGAIVDATLFDPYEERLSNLVDSGPAWLAEPLKDYLYIDKLQANEDDSKAVARLKAAFEGALLGTAVEGLVFIARIAKIKMLGKKQGLPQDEINKRVTDEVAKLREEFKHLEEGAEGGAKPPTPSVVRNPDGTHQAVADVPEDLDPTAKVFDDDEVEAMVKESEGKAAKPVQKAADDLDPTAQTFDDDEVEAMVRASEEKATKPAKQAPVGPPRDSPMEAQADAASFELQAKNLAKQDKPFLEAKNIEAWRNAVDYFKRTKDLRGAQEMLDQAGFNPGYVQQPKHIVAEIKALAASIPEAQLFARDKATGMLPPGQWTKNIKKEALKIAGDIINDDRALEHAAEVFGGTDRLVENLLALRTWQWYQAGQISKLSVLAKRFPNNGNYMDALVSAMNTLAQTNAFITGTTTRVGQTLQSHKVDLGPLVKKLQRTAPDAADEAAEAAEASVKGAEGAGKAPAKEQLSAADRIAVTDAARKAGHRAPDAAHVVAGMTKGEIQALANMIATAGDDLPKLLKLINGPKEADLLKHGNKVPPEMRKKWRKFVNTYRAEALLSGLPTQLGNVVVNAAMSFKRPMEYFFSGIQRGDKEHVDEAFDIAKGLFVHQLESMTAATKALIKGQETFDGLGKFADDVGNPRYTELTPEAFKGRGPVGAVGSGIHVVARMPSRLLMSADVYFKNLNGRAFAYAEEMKRIRQDRATGIAVDAATEAQRLRDAVSVSFDPNVGAINPKMRAYAQEVTFTDEMGELGKAGQQLIQKSEFLRFMFPFFRTPMRIFDHVHQTTPMLNLFNKKMLDDMAAGGERAALAAARADVGASIFAIGSFLALQGVVTGGGSVDPQLSRQLRQAGQPPYSIRVGDGFFEIRRGDPFTSHMMMIADLIQMSGEMDKNTRLDATKIVLATITRNVTSKTYLQSLHDFMEALQSEGGLERWARSAAKSMLAPNFVQRMNDDPYEREVQSVWDAVKSGWPGASESLPPVRNILGEKVLRPPSTNGNRFWNPFTYVGAPKDEEVLMELAEIGKAMPMPAEKWGDIDLKDSWKWEHKDPARKGQSPYDRFLELMSEPTWGDPPLRKRLEEVVKGDEYREAAGEDLYSAGGAKYNLVALEIAAYHDEAREQLFAEYPGLEDAWIAQMEGEAVGKWEGRKAAHEAMKEALPEDQKLFDLR